MTHQKNPVTDSLQSALSRLAMIQSQQLPAEARNLLQDAIQYLHTVGNEITAGEEQDRLAALYQVGQMLGNSLDLEEVLNHVMDAAIQLTNAERGFLILTTPHSPEIDVRISRNISNTDLASPEHKVSHTVIQTALNAGEGVVTTNAQEDPRFSDKESVISYSLRSILCAPIKARGEVLGVIYVDNRAQAGMFENDDLNLLNAFASQAASAIANAQQYAATNESLAARVQELEALVRFTRVTNTRSSLQEILEDTLDWSLSGTHAEQAWIAVFDEEDEASEELTVIAGSKRGNKFPNSAPLLAATLESNTPHIYEPSPGVPGRLVVPMLTKDATLGVIVAENETPFPIEDLNFLTRLANLAMTAADKLELVELIEDAKQEKAEFVSTVSHELRLPMTSIMGYTDLLKQGAMGEINEAQMSFLKIIRENADRMAKLIADLSDIYKAEGGRLHLEPLPMSLPQAVRSAAESVKEIVEEREQQIEIQVASEIPTTSGDAKRVSQMIEYLLENAALYSPIGATITVRAKVESDFVRLMVEDNGIGIAPEDQAMLYTQFFRSEVEEVREHKGWGLGLCVVKSLAALLNGETGYETEQDKGSTFWFTLPMA